MRFKKSSIPSGEQIEKLALSAARGDADALNELGALNEKLGRRANQNLRDLEKKGYTSYRSLNADETIALTFGYSDGYYFSIASIDDVR